MGPGQTDGAESAVGCRSTQVGGHLVQEGWEPSDSKSRWERCSVRSWAGPTLRQAWGVDSKQLRTAVAPPGYC